MLKAVVLFIIRILEYSLIFLYFGVNITNLM